jgi:hypothetical protein
MHSGNEESLMECQHDQFGDVFCPGDGSEIGTEGALHIILTHAQYSYFKLERRSSQQNIVFLLLQLAEMKGGEGRLIVYMYETSKNIVYFYLRKITTVPTSQDA